MTKQKKLFCDKTQKIQLWQNSKTQIMTVVLVTVPVGTVVILTYFSKKNQTTWQAMIYFLGSFFFFCDVFDISLTNIKLPTQQFNFRKI